MTLSKSSDKNFHPSYRADIDGLRSLAILMVVIFHAFPSKMKGGFIGVDVFFVISGYLISIIILKSLQNANFSFIDFYVHRIKRIFPALVLVVSSCYVLGWFALLPDEFKLLGKHVATGAGFVQNFALWKEAGYFDAASELKPLMHLWSLAIEEQFYLIYPVVIWFAWRLGLNVLTLTLASLFLSFFLNVHLIEKDTIKTFFLPQTRFWELLIGGCLAYMKSFRPGVVEGAVKKVIFHGIFFKKPPEEERQTGLVFHVFSIVGLTLIISSALLLDKEKNFPGWWALLPAMGSAMLIFSGANAWVNKKILSNKLMVFVGLISYPLYLWHWPILSFAYIVESGMPSREIRVGAVLASIVLAWLTCRFVERPIRFGGKSVAITVMITLAMVVIGFVGFYTFKNNGLEFRSAAEAIKINKFDYPYRNSCIGISKEDYGDDWCNFNGKEHGGANVALVGDSFSNAYSEMFIELSRSNASIVPVQIGRGQCPMLIGYGPKYCKDITEKTLKYIAEDRRIKTVVLAANWIAYSNGKNFHWLTYKESADNFWSSLDGTIRWYKSKGKKVVVLLAPPQGAKPRSCIVRPVRITNNNTCHLSMATVKENDGNYRDKLLPYLKSIDVRVFDPFPIFCSEKQCIIVDGKFVLWSDAGHMSLYGGIYLARNAKSELELLLNRGTD